MKSPSVCVCNKRQAKYAILKYNNSTEVGSDNGSGSKEMLDDSIRFKDSHKLVEAVTLKSGNNIVGWGVAWQSRFATAQEYHIYIRPEFRRKGYGTIIQKRASKKFKSHAFCPWDERSKAFFGKTKAQIHPSWG